VQKRKPTAISQLLCGAAGDGSVPTPPGPGLGQGPAEQPANGWSSRGCLWEHGILRHLEEKSAMSEKFLA